jgi:hypothetical protein
MRGSTGKPVFSANRDVASEIRSRTQQEIDRAQPGSLAEFFGVDVSGESLWSDGDLEAILEHQLRTRLDQDLKQGTDIPATDDSPAIETFADLFAHNQPPLELLDATREFAKGCRVDGQSRVPAEIATVLYFASIVAARVKLDTRISSLDDNTLAYGLDWALDQAWLAETLRRLLGQGQSLIQAERQDPDA